MLNPKVNEEKQEKATEYNFGTGHPSHSLNLPSELVAKCVEKLMNKDNTKQYKDAIDYGLCEGSWYFRSNLADWLNTLNSMNKDENNKQYATVSGTNITLTTGASHSMELLLIHLKRLRNKMNTDCKNIVLCEDPSYFLFPNIVETACCKLLAIPFINNSLDFNYLQSILQKYNQDIICFYVIPSHHNPLGISYTLEQKIKLLKLCHQYKIHLISDEVYNLLSFDDNIMMIPFLSSIEKTLYSNFNSVSDEEEKKETEPETQEFFCHSISSFSKIIGPGFRLGWIVSHNETVLKAINNHGSIRSGGNMTQFVPSLLAYLLDPNDEKQYMTKHLMKVRNVLGRNCKCLCEIIRKYDVDKLIKFNEPKGGYFMWLELPMNKMKIISDEKAKVKYFNGKKLSATFGPISKCIQFIDKDIEKENKQKYFHKCIRFCFAYLNEKQICDGARVFMESIYNDE